MPKQVTQSTVGGVTTITTDIDGVRTIVAKPQIHAVVNGDIVAKTAYKLHRIWNPSTQAYISVTTTGNEAQDAQLLAAAFVTAGVRTDLIISST